MHATAFPTVASGDRRPWPGLPDPGCIALGNSSSSSTTITVGK